MTLMASASQGLLWRVRPDKKSKCIDVADGSIGYIGSSVHTGDIPLVKLIRYKEKTKKGRVG